MKEVAHLVQILLPIASRDTGQASLETVLQELTARFGGATAFVNSPARGLWDDGDSPVEDRIVSVEVMVEVFDEVWWRDYRRSLEQAFQQEEIVVRALPMQRI